MVERELEVSFHREPLRFLDRTFPAAGDAAWLPGRQLCVAEPEAARAVLINSSGLYEEHSDFFHTRKGWFGPREAQERIGRAARTVLRDHVAARAGALAESVRRELAPAGEWPDAGNWLIYRHLAGALAAPGTPPRLRRTLDGIVERSVLAGARERRSAWSRRLFRFRALRELAREITARRARGAAPPRDLLDAVAGGAEPGATAAELAEVFVSFVFALAGSVGFALGWSVYLWGTHRPADADPAWVVHEALRLWPVAWLLGRRPARAHQVAGVEVTPDDRVVVCPYAIHRRPDAWEEPESFRPERWATTSDHRAFLPFGWGAHRCVAAALSMQLAEDVLRLLVERYHWTMTVHDPRPSIGSALAPPRFTLALAPRERSTPTVIPKERR